MAAKIHQGIIASGTSRSRCRFHMNFSSKVSIIDACPSVTTEQTRAIKQKNGLYMSLHDDGPRQAAHVALQRAADIVVVAEVESGRGRQGQPPERDQKNGRKQNIPSVVKFFVKYALEKGLVSL